MGIEKPPALGAGLTIASHSPYPPPARLGADKIKGVVHGMKVWHNLPVFPTSVHHLPAWAALIAVDLDRVARRAGHGLPAEFRGAREVVEYTAIGRRNLKRSSQGRGDSAI
ncbi:MAG TPA: hypothetical protein DCR97_09120 [Deltaproteobacteria bacterium]|nr:hypothetical protein [Deltaproteobacteria bacterium]